MLKVCGLGNSPNRLTIVVRGWLTKAKSFIIVAATSGGRPHNLVVRLDVISRSPLIDGAVLVWLGRCYWLQLLVTDVDQLSLVKATTQVLIALTVVGKADTCDAHALGSNLVIPGASEVAIVGVTLATSREDKAVVLHLIPTFRFFFDILSLIRRNVLAEATILLVLQRMVLGRRISLLERFLHLFLHHLNFNVHPLHLAVVVFAQTLDLGL